MKKSGKICMLDGDSEVRQLFADWCGLRNYELLATDNLFQFLRYSKEMQPDLFVLDLDMKDVSGWEVAGMLASDEGLKEIPIVMLMLSEQQRRKLSRLIVSGVKSMMFCCLTNMERSRQRPC